MADERRVVVRTNMAPEADPATSQAIVQNGNVFVSAQTGKSPTGDMPSDFATQFRNALYNTRAILESAASDMQNILRVQLFLSDSYYLDEMDMIFKEFFATQDPPVRDVVIVSAIPGGALISVSVTASMRASF